MERDRASLHNEPRHPVITYETIDSTNSEAQRQAAKGERGPVWIRAEQQTGGRGRSGRPWSSPRGNLCATFLFAPGCRAEQLQQLSFVAGIAAVDAVQSALDGADEPKGAVLKWPNDVLIDGAKVAGVLVESTIVGPDILAMIGFGINVAVAPAIDGRDVTAIGDHAPDPGVEPFRQALEARLDHWLAEWTSGDRFDAIREAWLARAHPLGEQITVRSVENAVHGTFAGLDADGALRLCRPSGEIERFHFGDVALSGGPRKPEDEE